jgi:Cu/Ag efflux protein CusF
MKSLVRTAMIVGLAVAVLAVTQTTRAADAKAEAKRAQGQIESVDVKASTLVLKHKKETMTFAVPANVEFGGAGKKTTLADLKVGDHVTIDYTSEGGKMTAHRIGHVDPKATEKKD